MNSGVHRQPTCTYKVQTMQENSLPLQVVAHSYSYSFCFQISIEVLLVSNAFCWNNAPHPSIPPNAPTCTTPVHGSFYWTCWTGLFDIILNTIDMMYNLCHLFLKYNIKSVFCFIFGELCLYTTVYCSMSIDLYSFVLLFFMKFVKCMWLLAALAR